MGVSNAPFESNDKTFYFMKSPIGKGEPLKVSHSTLYTYINTYNEDTHLNDNPRVNEYKNDTTTPILNKTYNVPVVKYKTLK